MAKTYANVLDLITEVKEASRYFYGLPAYVQEQIRSRGSNVNSLDSLKDYAENLLRGDG